MTTDLRTAAPSATHSDASTGTDAPAGPDTTPLRHPVWNALTGRQARFALGDARARRYHPEIGPLAAARDAEPESLAALARLVPPDGPLVTVQETPFPTPPGLIVEKQRALVQMIAPGAAPACAPDESLVPLTAGDAPAMLALARLAKPGPFAGLTGCLGQFWGLYAEGQLVAMTGERMHLPGFAEISGVSTHPDYRGRGYARRLLLRVMAQIARRGEIPFLQSYADNVAATTLYGTVGFRPCGERLMTVLRRAE